MPNIDENPTYIEKELKLKKLQEIVIAAKNILHDPDFTLEDRYYLIKIIIEKAEKEDLC